MEAKVSEMLKKTTICFGCGRTDAMVHASQYFFHIEVDKPFDYDPVFRLNKILPKDIAVFDCIEVPLKANARYDASRRTYDYFIHSFKDAHLNNLSSEYDVSNLDLEKMKEACQLFVQQEDFRALCRTPDKHNHTLCQVDTAKLYVDNDKKRLRFEVSANRFLKQMIRLMVGHLLMVGRGKTSIESLKKNMDSGEASSKDKAAFPQGLYLSKVEYPYLELPSKSHVAAVLKRGLVEV